MGGSDSSNSSGFDSSNSSGFDSAADMASGTESELCRIPGAQLYLLDGEESVRMGAGNLTLVMIVQAASPLATLVAQVAEFQWPMGRDGPVLKIAPLRYTFAIPGLLYGVILPDETYKDLVEMFEAQLRQYCAFESRPEIARKAGVSDLRLWSSVGRSVDGSSVGARYWTAVAEDVKGYSAKLVKRMKSSSTAAANTILLGGEWASWGVREGGSFIKRNTSPGGPFNGEEMSPRMRKRVDQARRMSAIAKLLSRTVLKGAISASGHVANYLGSAIGEVPAMQAVMSSDSRREVVMASVDAFAKIVEAVETAGKSLVHATSAVGAEFVQHKMGDGAGQVARNGMDTMGNVLNTMWTLNKVGLNMLWRATAASTAINSSSMRSRSGAASASSSDIMSLPSVNLASVSKSRSLPQSQSPTLSLKSLSSTASQQQPSPPPLSPPPPQQQQQPGLPTISLAPPNSVSPPASRDVVQTVQLLPPPFYAVPAHPGMYIHPQTMISTLPPGYAYYPPPHPNGPFQQYTRPGAPPQVQYFPFGMDAPKTQ